MDILNYDLSLLARAVHYPNLTGAAEHVGLSQSQLSRVVAKLEDLYGVQLLDRDSKRKAGWTIEAQKLADLYLDTSRRFKSDIQSFLHQDHLENLAIGTLEGLAPLVSKFADDILAAGISRIVEVRVLDLGDLDEDFLNQSLDMIFTSRAPGRKKFQWTVELGYQSLDLISSAKGKSNVPLVFSPYQFARHEKSLPSKQKILISNALFVRKLWVEEFGGTGTLPSTLTKKKPTAKEVHPVLCVGQTRIPKSMWDKLRKLL